jgi:hypothetical protein
MVARGRGVLWTMNTITRTTALTDAILSGALAIATLFEPAHEPGRAQLKPAEFVTAELDIKGSIQHPRGLPLRTDVLPPRAPA